MGSIPIPATTINMQKQVQYILSEEEYNTLSNRNYDLFKDLVEDLRTKVLELSKFTCYHDIPKDSPLRQGVDEGYCDDCPLSFTKNDGKKSKYSMCGRNNKLYSK